LGLEQQEVIAMRSIHVACLVPLGLFLAACGGSDAGDTGGAGGGGGSGPATPPPAPSLDMVMPMAGALHVEWSSTVACDAIEAERKDTMNPTYAVAFTEPGTKTSHMDGNATANLDYTYRLRCKVGAHYSDYSNEKSANPTKP
jgi:hypothetical protein